MKKLTVENSLDEECIRLLKSLRSKGQAFTSIADLYSKTNPDVNTGTLALDFTNILKHGNFNKGSVTVELVSFLTQLDKKTASTISSDSTIVFYYWSEGKSNNESEDELKTAFILIDLKQLKNLSPLSPRTSKICELRYPKREPLDGSCQIVGDAKVLNLIFDQGTSLLMSIPNSFNDCFNKFYKGTYIVTPGGYTACGIALFEVQHGIDINAI